MDAYACYLEDIKFMGVPLEGVDDVVSMGWYCQYLNNVEKRLIEEEDNYDSRQQ